MEKNLEELIRLLEEFEVENWVEYFKGTLEKYSIEPFKGGIMYSLHMERWVVFGNAAFSYNKPMSKLLRSGRLTAARY